MSFGLVAPLLYYVIVLPASIWIGLLFAVEAAGRLVGSLVLQFLQPRLGVKRTLILSHSLIAVSYGILSTASHFHGAVVFEVIYLSRFLGSSMAAGFPSERLLFQPSPRAGGRVMLGFAVGCLLTIPWNLPRILPDSSILPTGGLDRSAELAAVVSAMAAMLALRWSGEDARLDSVASSATTPQRGKLVLVALLCQTAFGMALCTLPLMAWETYHFAPAQMAMLLGGIALISQSTRYTAQSSRLPAVALLNVGIVLAAVAFFGFTAALKLSWVTQPVDGMKVGYWLVWIGGIPAGIGHGLLRNSLRGLFENSKQAQPVRYLDWAGALVAGGAALVGAMMWLAHERTSLAIPCALAVLSLPVGISCLGSVFKQTEKPSVVASR